MKQKAISLLQYARQFLRNNKKLIIGLGGSGFILIIGLVLACSLLIGSNKKYILPPSSDKHVRVGIVLGAGITKQGKPFKELQARLDVAAKAIGTGQVDKLILSGDNRFNNYDEPTAMKDYLVNVKHISEDKLQPDFAGRSTYESCERASKVFRVKETIIYSAGYHLQRAIYLCRHFGITTYGVAGGLEDSNSTRRELMARVKAVYNLYIKGEPTVLGPAVKI